MKALTFDIDFIISKSQIESELELEQCLNAHRKLRFLVKENPDLKKKRIILSDMIHEYESKHWSMNSTTSKQQMFDSDEAEILVEREEKFIESRKKLIKSKLSKLNLNQQEFGQIIGHNSKSYMSELMNGVNSFSLKDLIVISKLLKINLNDLVFRTIPIQQRRKIEQTIKKLAKPKLMLDSKEFAFG